MIDPVDLLDARDAEHLGGKAVQLGASLRGRLPVPLGVALPAGLVDAVAAGDGEAIGKCSRAFARLGGDGVAVRSSAVGEDGAHASFAGQHLTRLSVRSEDAALEAIRAVWASAREPSALAYRQRLGLSGEPRIAVVLQRMVEPECAGVMFTRDPLTRQDVRLVEAAWGLGEAVVSGLVDPDRYRFRRGGELLEQSIGNKEVAIRSQAAGHTAEVEVPPEDRERACLDGARLSLLDALASRCDAVFDDGSAHDIEWAFSGGELFLLQRRPVTR